MYMSRSELVHYYNEILKIIAQHQRIQDSDVKSTMELIEEIDPRVMKQYESFKQAYEAWYAFHESIEREDKSGNLSEIENKQLMDLIEARDETRKALIELAKQ